MDSMCLTRLGWAGRTILVTYWLSRRCFVIFTNSGQSPNTQHYIHCGPGFYYIPMDRSTRKRTMQYAAFSGSLHHRSAFSVSVREKSSRNRIPNIGHGVVSHVIRCRLIRTTGTFLVTNSHLYSTHLPAVV